MAKFIMGIGLPGSGKTSVLRSFAKRYKYIYIGADDVRTEFNLSRGETSTKEVWDTIQERVKENIEKGNTVVVDATFAIGPNRRRAIEFARECGAEKVQGIFVDIPAELARARNDMRDQRAPEDIFVGRLHDIREQPPNMQDGFDGLFTLDEYQRVIKAEFAREKKELSREKTRFS